MVVVTYIRSSEYRCGRMNEIELQGKSIEALKSFNNTIVTSRLYPPEAPQVASVVDRGYHTIKLYTHSYGDLMFSRKGGAPCLRGEPLRQETLDLFPNLVIYRQLRLLGLSRLVIGSEIDRFAFGQLLAVFNASVEKIKNEGGGLEYITSLGLAGYFPDEAEESGDDAGSESYSDDIQGRKQITVRPEIIACLFGKDNRPIVEDELQKKMATAETAIDLLAVSISDTLQDIQEKKKIVASQNFPLILKKAETLIHADDRQGVAQGLAKTLANILKDPGLCILLAQEYPEGFGSTVYDGLVTCLTIEKLTGIMGIFKDLLVKARRIGGTESPQVQCLGKALMLLMNSRKGKQLLSAEKARNIIREGERERKKRRLEAGIRGFLQGNVNLLKSVELVKYLPHAVRQLRKSTDRADVSILLNGIVASLKECDTDVKEALLNSMITIAENLLIDGQWNHVDLIVEPLMSEVGNGGFGELMMEKALTLLQQVMQKSWQDGQNDRGDRILNLLYQIRSGQLYFTTPIQTIAAKVQDRGIRRANLPQLLTECLAAPKEQTLSYRLVLQGPVALRFLVEALINSDSAADRIKIIDLLTYSPNFLPSVIHERLQEHMPWYAKRNLIKLLGDTGKEEDVESILPYLCHDDFRVQRETFLTLYKIAGRKRKQVLVKALEESSDYIKIQIVSSLANFCGEDVAKKLVELLISHEQFDENNREDLLLQLLDTLGRCVCPTAHKGIEAFLQTRRQRSARKISDQVWAAAEKSLKFLHNELQENRKKHVLASQMRKNALKQVAKMSKTAISRRVITGSVQEQTVQILLSRGDKTAAAEKILELIERAAHLRNFVQAEKLSEWLIEIDPTALSHIVRAAEIIDREKLASVDKGHLEIWRELYDVLTTEEFSAVYHAMEPRVYENEEVIISQGSFQGSLFFINSGKVKLYCDDQGSEALFDTIGRGKLFGMDSFFEASVWTISVAAIGPTKISVLNVDCLLEWKDSLPELEAKLHIFCQKFEKLGELVQRSSNDRRMFNRQQIEGMAATTLLDNRGKGIGTVFTAELVDISEGGISFLVPISQKVNARLLLGRKIQLKFQGKFASGEDIILAGDILAIKSHETNENDYSLHMKFDNLLGKKKLYDIVMAMREESQVIK